MKTAFIFLTLLNFLFAQNLNIQKVYSISYGIFGELGIATASIKVDKQNNYTITMHAKATGVAKFLSQSKEEIYTSKGKLINNQFVPDTFSKHVKNDVKTKKATYTIDHPNKQVTKDSLKTKKDRQTNKWNTYKNSEILDYYAKNDILSLFFNLKYYIKEFSKGNEHDLHAVGANEDNGLINVIVPTKKEHTIINQDLKTTQDTILKVFINQEIFSSERGELLISLDKKGLCDRTVLKDVLLFGDIRAKVVN
ncbi:MAG: DUF3108 domain-containing protein [Campylobacterota bacterium]|nr:DUF3108 domain-containing protein [Campylobacterota bacterium]